MTCAPSEDSDQPVHPPSLIECQSDQSSLSAGRKLESLATLVMIERTAKTDQADQSLRWAHRSFCWFCHAAAQTEL